MRVFLSRNFLFGGWVFASICLLLYSFTQIDLNLTFSQFSIWQVIQKAFQYIGYFQRPLSIYLYTGIILLLFLLYLFTLLSIRKGILLRRDIWKIVITVSVVLFASYNAFSYDLFNYIFDAKIVTHYNENPYISKPQDFIGDPMLTFMRSVHRPYPYGPVWLLLTVPLSFIGSGIFLVTFYLFKLLMVGAFLGTAFYIEKILKVVKAEQSTFGLALFALSPLVVVESLVSAHNDIVMMFLAVASFYFLIQKKHATSLILLFLSIGIKFASIILLPVFLYVAFLNVRKKTINFNTVFLGLYMFSLIGVFITAFASGVNKNPELQPWYFLNLFPFLAFIYNRRFLFILSVILSLTLLTSYIFYIAAGEWPKDIVMQKNITLLGSVVLAIAVYLFSLKRIQSSTRKFS